MCSPFRFPDDPAKVRHGRFHRRLPVSATSQQRIRQMFGVHNQNPGSSRPMQSLMSGMQGNRSENHVLNHNPKSRSLGSIHQHKKFLPPCHQPDLSFNPAQNQIPLEPHVQAISRVLLRRRCSKMPGVFWSSATPDHIILNYSLSSQ